MARFLRIAIGSAILTLCAGLASADHVVCSQDLNGDGKANHKDIQFLDAAMGGLVGQSRYDERADLNQDDRINEEDREAYKHCAPVVRARPARTR